MGTITIQIVRAGHLRPWVRATAGRQHARTHAPLTSVLSRRKCLHSLRRASAVRVCCALCPKTPQSGELEQSVCCARPRTQDHAAVTRPACTFSPCVGVVPADFLAPILMSQVGASPTCDGVCMQVPRVYLHHLVEHASFGGAVMTGSWCVHGMACVMHRSSCEQEQEHSHSRPGYGTWYFTHQHVKLAAQPVKAECQKVCTRRAQGPGCRALSNGM